MVATTNLTNYYKFTEDAGNKSVVDAHGSDDGTASVNTASLATTGHITGEGAFEFNGSTEDIDFSTPLIAASGEFTINCWVYVTSITKTSTLYAQYIAGNAHRFILAFTSADKLLLQIGSAVVGGTAVPLNEWFMVTGTRESDNTIRVYLNGTSDGSISNSTTTLQQNSIFASYGTGAFIVGKIGNVAIFSEDIGSSGVSDLYNSGDGLAYPFSAATGWGGKIQEISPGKVDDVAKADIKKIQGVE